MAIASGEIIAAPRPHGSSPWAEGPRFHPVRALAEALSAEGERRVHWLPVFLGAGIATYFTLTVEPPWWLGLAATAGLRWRLRLALRRIPARATVAILLAFAAAGFRADPVRGVAGRHADARPPPRLGRADRPGRRCRSASTAAGASSSRRIRCPVSRPTSSRAGCASASRRPATRCSPATASSMRAGSTRRRRRSCRAGWDLQRALYFAGIGAVGYSFGPARRVAAPGEARGGGWRDWLLRLRNEMTARINAALPGSTGGVASALITGKRGTMAEEVAQAFRDSGLAHLLAISGLHLGAGRRVRVLCGARRPGADPVRRAALSDQEDRRGRRPWPSCSAT